MKNILLLVIVSVAFRVSAQTEFIITWQTTSDSESITIPTTGTGYNYTVDWGDGNTESGFTGDADHTYATAGTYTVAITGDFPRIFFNDWGGSNPSTLKIQSIDQWGDQTWSSMASAFEGCKNLTYRATDVPDLSSVTSLSEIFRNCQAFNGDIGSWDVSSATDMSIMFYRAEAFNQNISNWDVSNVTIMYEMFKGAEAFNQELSSWNVCNVTDMRYMLRNSGLSTGTYDALLTGWSQLTLQSGVTFRANRFYQNKLLHSMIPNRRPKTVPDPMRQEKLDAFDRLLTIMDELRENCPWDKKQTMESLRHLTIEETYELSDAIIENDLDGIRGELGDLMLHLAFYSRIGSENGTFHIGDVLDGVCEKLIRRHPHIYADVDAKEAKAVKENWEKIKLKEKGNNSVLGGVPKSLPALVKAMRIQEKARGVGFDWEKRMDVWEKVKEEMDEFEIEEDEEKKAGEFGDLLFSLINYARFVDINPEEALERTNKKFIQRFQYLEENSKKDGKQLGEMSLEEMDEYWEEAKWL